VTVSGNRSLTVEENLNPVPGAATADDWKVHLPAGGPLAKLVTDAVKKDDHLSAAEPVLPTISERQPAVGALNQGALASWADEKP
jgi:hypothetical protein